jgi:ArsR family transcriptional regulator, arsenate/arsenite/antimonite-responsive transcriptional repressor / arsenate reductase (thioredoxin)
MNEETAHFADVFAALGSEPRLDIMRLLFANSPDGMTVGELQAQLKIPSSTLSHHLDKLRVEGLVAVQRDRQFLWYSANIATVEALLSFLYNGCSVQNRVAQSAQPEQILDLNLEKTPAREGIMFENFLRSIQAFFGELRLALPGFERFTPEAIQSIHLAQDESRRLQQNWVGTEQILVGLLEQDSGLAAQVLKTAGIEIEPIQQIIERHIGRGQGTSIEIPFTPRAKEIFKISLRQARLLGHSYLGTEHLLLGILVEGKGLGIRSLEEIGFNCKALEQQLRTAMS